MSRRARRGWIAAVNSSKTVVENGIGGVGPPTVESIDDLMARVPQIVCDVDANSNILQFECPENEKDRLLPNAYGRTGSQTALARVFRYVYLRTGAATATPRAGRSTAS